MNAMPPAEAAIRAEALSVDAERHFNETPGKLWIPNAIPRNNNVGFAYSSVEQAFPAAPVPWQPLGATVMVQIRQALRRTQGGLVIDSDMRQTDQDNTQIGKVVAIGALAFRRRETGEPWPEGAWCQIGDFVRVPKYQGDRSVVESVVEDIEYDEKDRKRVVRTKDTVVFVCFKDLAIIGKYETAEAALRDRAFI